MSNKTTIQTNNTTISNNNVTIDDILEVINTLPNIEDLEPTLQEKTVSPSTSSQTVTPDANYDGLSKVTVNAIKLQSKTATPSTSSQTIKPDSSYNGLSQVTVNAMTTATQATPSISVSSSGLITASATQTAGYVSAGTKSATKQLTTKAATTITPGTSNKTAVAKNVYTTGAITVKGDSNLVASNIKSGVSIFGVTGTMSASGGSGLATGTLSFVVSGYANSYRVYYVDANGSLVDVISPNSIVCAVNTPIFIHVNVSVNGSYIVSRTLTNGVTALSESDLLPTDQYSYRFCTCVYLKDTQPEGTITLTISLQNTGGGGFND